jgi:DNA-binding transcriptional LysR family regulator
VAKAYPKPTDVQLPHLETFSKAAEFASFTRAAESLCMTQAAVSQHIHAIEKELRVALFTRHAGKVELTEAGRLLYEFAQRILTLHVEARCALGQMSGEVAGELRIAASAIPAEHFLMGLLAEFHRAHPQIHVVPDVGDSETVVSAVEQSKVTLGIAGRRLAVPWAEYQLFAKDRLTLVVPSGHAWQSRSAVTVEELRTQAMVVREPGSGTRACLERALATRNLTLADFRVSLEVGTNEAVKDAVFRGLGVAVLSIRIEQCYVFDRCDCATIISRAGLLTRRPERRVRRPVLRNNVITPSAL